MAPLHQATIVGLLGALALPAQAQLLTHHDLSYAMAKTIAETAIESCGAHGYAGIARGQCQPSHAGERSTQGLHRAQFPHVHHGLCQAVR